MMSEHLSGRTQGYRRFAIALLGCRWDMYKIQTPSWPIGYTYRIVGKCGYRTVIVILFVLYATVSQVRCDTMIGGADDVISYGQKCIP